MIRGWPGDFNAQKMLKFKQKRPFSSALIKALDSLQAVADEKSLFKKMTGNRWGSNWQQCIFLWFYFLLLL